MGDDAETVAYIEALVDARVAELVAQRKEAYDLADDPQALAARGMKNVRIGSVEKTKFKRSQPNDAFTTMILISRHQEIERRVAQALGTVIIDTFEDLIAARRWQADYQYGLCGLPTGFSNYWIKDDQKKSDWGQWTGGEAPFLADGIRTQCRTAGELAKIGGFDDDHPVMHAARLHECAWELEREAAREPINVLNLSLRAMHVQKAKDALESVTVRRRNTAKRGSIGMTLAEAVWAGEASLRYKTKNGAKGGEGNKEASLAIRHRISILANPIRAANPTFTDEELVEAVAIKLRKYPAAQMPAPTTIHKHIRALKASGDLPSRQVITKKA